MKNVKRVILFTLILSLCSGLFAQETIVTLKRFALVIGNQDYEEFPLNSTAADAELIKNVLEGKGFEVSFYQDLKETEITQAFDDYISVVNGAEKAVSMIYFAGHGFTDGDENYFVPVDNGTIHSEEELKEHSVSLSAIADRIYTSSQIYVVDGAYDNPFLNVEETRGLAVKKGSLAAARSRQESNITYLFSAEPEMSVLEVEGKNSIFAQTLAYQIENGEGTVDEVFMGVRSIVDEETEGQQVPYVSATGSDFAFNGEQLARLQNQQQDAELEVVQEETKNTLEAIEQYEAELKAIYEEKMASAANAKEKLEAELEYKRQMRIQEDERRAFEEAEAAKNRKAEENAEIERAKAEFTSLAAEQKVTLSKKVGAEEKINAIEQMKESICAIRDDIQAKKDAYNDDKDEETSLKIQEIRDAEYRMTETDSMGNPTKDALELRKKKIAAVRTAAEKDKVQRGKELQASIQATDDKAMAQLKATYNALESGTYTTNSFTNDLTVRIGNFDGQTGTWPLTVTSELFGYTTLFNQEIPLSYSDVTGKKYKPINKMNEAQFAEYTETVELYDSLFRSSTEVFYVSLTYKISKWSWASQYRFEPVKCEIVRLDKKNKVLHKVGADDMKKLTFTMYPSYEVRSKAAIEKEQKKIAERIAKEEKADAKKHPVTPSVYGSENSSVRVSTGTSAAAKASVSSDNSQKGRGCLLVTADVNLPSNPLQDFDFNKLTLNSLSAELTFKTGKFSFVGLEGTVLYPFDTEDLSFSAGLETGFNARLGFVRPFVKVGADLNNQLFTTGKVGTGFDFIMFKVVDVTIGCDYNWQIDTMGLISHNNGPEFNNYLNKYHKVYAGAGFAW